MPVDKDGKTKQSFCPNCVPKLELGNENEIYGAPVSETLWAGGLALQIFSNNFMIGGLPCV